MSIAYLGSPYTHKDPKVMQKRFEQVKECAAWMLANDIPVFSPIAMCHEMTYHNEDGDKMKLPPHWEWWRHIDFAFISQINRFYALCLDGWEKSRGLQEEIQFCRVLNKPVSYVYPRHLAVLKIDSQFFTNTWLNQRLETDYNKWLVFNDPIGN